MKQTTQLFLLTVFSILILGSLLPSYAEELYGITRDGKLVHINQSTGAGAVVRTLPGTYTNFDSVEWADGKFYASYNGGNILKFGFTAGDEVNLGSSGYPVVEGLGRRPDGRVFAVISQNSSDSSNDDGRSESLGELNLSTGAITVAAQPANATTNGVGASFETIAYTDNTNFYVSKQDGGSIEVASCDMIPLTSSSSYFSPGGILPSGGSISWGVITGMAVIPAMGEMYGVTGYEPDQNLVRQVIPSVLYLLNYTTPSLTQQTIGSVGVNGLVGLTFADDCEYYDIGSTVVCL